MIKFISLALFTGLLAQAQLFDLPVTVTPFKNVNIMCQSSGALIAISEADQVYWQADPGNRDGLQFKTVSWNKARCFHCFEAEGVLKIGDTVLRTAISSKYNLYSKKLDLTYYVYNEAGVKEVALQPKDFNCVVK